MQVSHFLFVLGCVFRLVFHVLPRPLAWDASVYAGMAKYVVTAGHAGLWEPLRPLVWPLLLSPFALSPFLLVWAHVLQFLAGAGVMVLVYLIAKEVAGYRAGLWALGFVALSPVVWFYEHQLLTEQLAALFALLAVWLVMRRGWLVLLAGVCAALSFVTKFPMGLVVVGLGLSLVTLRRWKDFLVVGCGFGIPLFCFLVVNAVLYQNPLAAVVAANDVIQTSGLWLYESGVLFYAMMLVGLNVLFAFALPGMLVAWRKQRPLLFVTVLVFLYWSWLPHKEIRFVPLFLPMVAIFAAAGWSLLAGRASESRFKHAFSIAAVLLVAVAGVQAVRWTQYYLYDEGVIDGELQELYRFAASHPALVSSDPRVVWFTNNPVVPLYYPLFPQTLRGGLDALKRQKALLYNPCDVPCSPVDVVCLENRIEFERRVDQSWVVERQLQNGDCSITFFTRS